MVTAKGAGLGKFIGYALSPERWETVWFAPEQRRVVSNSFRRQQTGSAADSPSVVPAVARDPEPRSSLPGVIEMLET